MNYKNYELLVRKRLATFLERLLQYLGYDLRHETFKKIMYGELCVNTDSEQNVKNYYDAYVYLLNNAKNTFTQEIFGKFLYIITGKQWDRALRIRITNLFYSLLDLAPLEMATEFHLRAFQEMIELSDEERKVISLMLLNYVLVKNDIPTIYFPKVELVNYYTKCEKWFEGKRTDMYLYIENTVLHSKFQEKTYYKNLRTLTSSEIITQLKHDEEMLKTNYGVKHVTLYGSFSKGNQRIDSDIDIFINFSYDLTWDQKQKNIRNMTDYYFNIFNRHMDINEIGEYLLDDILKETKIHKKIF